MIHIKLDRNLKTKKEIENLKHILNIKTNKKLFYHILMNYNKLIQNSFIHKNKQLYFVEYSDGSKDSVLLSELEIESFKNSIHSSSYLSDDITVKSLEKFKI